MSRSFKVGIILVTVSIIAIMAITFLVLSPREIATLTGTNINISNIPEIIDSTYIPHNSIKIKIDNPSINDKIDIYLDHKIDIETKETENSKVEIIKSEKNYTSLTGYITKSLTFTQKKYEVRFTSNNSDFTITIFSIYDNSEKFAKIKTLILISVAISCVSSSCYLIITKPKRH